jgi:hypothetical protein
MRGWYTHGHNRRSRPRPSSHLPNSGIASPSKVTMRKWSANLFYRPAVFKESNGNPPPLEPELHALLKYLALEW